MTCEAGEGRLHDLTPLGPTVALSGMGQGSLVIVRTNYFPAWRADAAGVDVPLIDVNGQLGFRTPKDGNYSVTLRYPRRAALDAVAASCRGSGASRE